jgi:hypothetical protein
MSVCLVLAIIVGLMFNLKRGSTDKSPSAANSNAVVQQSASQGMTQPLATTVSEEADPEVTRVLSLAQQYRGLTMESLKARPKVVVREEIADTFTTLHIDDPLKGEKATYVFEAKVPIKVRVKNSNESGYYFLLSPDGIADQYLEYGTDDLVSVAVEFYPSGKPSWVRHLTNGMYFGVTEHYNEQGALIDSTNYTTPTPVVLNFWPHGLTNLGQKSP